MVAKSNKATSEPVKLYVKGSFQGFKRGQRTQTERQALLRLQGVQTRTDAVWYHGKRVAYIYRKNNTKTNTSYKAIWGKVIASHGNSGLVRAHFAKNLPPRAIGATVRVMLYPNKQI